MAKLKKMQPIIKTSFIEEKMPYTNLGGANEMYRGGSYYYLPYVDPEMTVHVPVEHQQFPPGELAVHWGTRVEATDGYTLVTSKNSWSTRKATKLPIW